MTESQGDEGDLTLLWPDPNWRDSQEVPCMCRPSEYADDCPRYDECYEAFRTAQEKARG